MHLLYPYTHIHCLYPHTKPLQWQKIRKEEFWFGGVGVDGAEKIEALRLACLVVMATPRDLDQLVLSVCTLERPGQSPNLPASDCGPGRGDRPVCLITHDTGETPAACRHNTKTPHHITHHNTTHEHHTTDRNTGHNKKSITHNTALYTVTQHTTKITHNNTALHTINQHTTKNTSQHKAQQVKPH